MIPKFGSFVAVVFIIAGALVFFGGLHSYLFEYEENQCEMTYMYEIPEYLEVPLRPSIKKRFPGYRLYLYGEGAYAKRDKSMQLMGVPVLFVPGNAGSYKQVRSLASVALRKSESRNTAYHFDFFSVDFDEELAGLYGGYLDSQAEFVSSCIDEILDGALYRNVPRRNQIVLVGHSVGGLHTRYVAAQKRRDAVLNSSRTDRVAVVIELATPNNAPVFAFDESIAAFYEQLNSNFTAASDEVRLRIGALLQDPQAAAEQLSFATLKNAELDSEGRVHQLHFVAHAVAPLANVTFVSIGGGARDVLVPYRFTPFLDHQFIVTDNKRPVSVRVSQYAYSLSVSSNAIRNVWASADHRCIAWCKQLVMRVVDTLFNLIDPKSSSSVNAQISADPDRRFDVVERSFRTCDLATTRSRRLLSLLKTSANHEQFDNPESRFVSRNQSRWLFTTSSIQAETIVLTPLQIGAEQNAPLAALFNQARSAVTVYACQTDSSERCTSGLRIDEPLLCDLPPSEWRFGSLMLGASEIHALRTAGFTHVAFRIAATKDELDLRVDRAPSHFLVPSGVMSAFIPVVATPSANSTVVFHRLQFPDLSRSLDTYQVEIVPKRCRRAQKGLIGTARFVAPNCVADEHTLVWQNEPTIVRVYSPASCSSASSETDFAYLDVIVDPECFVDLKVSFDVAGFAAQIIRFHASAIFCGLIASVLLGLIDSRTRSFIIAIDLAFVALWFTPQTALLPSNTIVYFAIAVNLAYCVNQVVLTLLSWLISLLQIVFCLRRRVSQAKEQEKQVVKSSNILLVIPFIASAMFVNSTVSLCIFAFFRLLALLVTAKEQRRAKLYEFLLLLYCGALFAPVGIVWVKRLMGLWFSGALKTINSETLAAVPLVADYWKWQISGLMLAASNVVVRSQANRVDDALLLAATLFTLWCGYMDTPYLVPTALGWSYFARLIGSFLK